MTEAPDRGTGSEPFRKTDHRQGTQCGQSTLGSFRMAPIPYSHYQRPLSGGRAREYLPPCSRHLAFQKLGVKGKIHTMPSKTYTVDFERDTVALYEISLGS